MAEHCECAGRLARLICRRKAVQKRHLAGWCRPSTVPVAITTLDVGGPGARSRQSDADEVGGVEAS
eukprot:scaffold97422_cov36-Phaeocystis_antarctica.AAC.1